MVGLSGTPLTRQEQVFLKLQVAESLPILISMIYTQEVFSFRAERISPMPNLPPFVLGMLNQRSRVCWIIDLAHYLGLPALDPKASNYMAAIVRDDLTSVGLAVSEVSGVIRLTSNVEPEPQTLLNEWSQKLRPYIQGWIQLSEENLGILNVKSLIHSPQLSLKK